jgi:ABC-type sugar transport system substrate-binding protein
MGDLRLALVAVENNDFQAMQAAAAKAAATRLGIELHVVQIEHDAVLQSQEVLKLLQRPADTRPHGIMFEPVGTPLAQAARLASSSGVGWVVLNRATVDYIPELRAKYQAPMFSVTTSHTDVGRLQGEQMARLLPNGGKVLYIQGPSSNDASVQRTAGMEATRPANIELRLLKGTWTEISGYEALSSFLRLSTSREASIGMVVAQNDAMALGARRAFQELTSGAHQERYLNLPFLGCDGLPDFGQEAVRKSQLAATVVVPANAGRAVEVLAAALRNREKPPERIMTQVESFPPLASLKPRAM